MVDSVGLIREQLDSLPQAKIFYGYWLRRFAWRGRFRLFGGLIIAVVLVANALGQNSGSTSAVPPSALPAQPAQAPASTSGTPETAADSTASQPAEPEGGGFVFRKEVEEVALRAIVVDPQNHLISGLNRDAFTVYEDGKVQKMTSFRQENAPLAMGVLIDNSGSMRPKRQKVNDAVLNLVRSSNPGDEVFVVNFGDQYYLDQDFTDDVGLLRTALNKIETRGTTALYDAMVASAAHVRQGARIKSGSFWW